MTTLSFLLATLVELSVGKICSYYFSPIIWGEMTLVACRTTQKTVKVHEIPVGGKKRSQAYNMYWCFFMERVKGPKRSIKCQIHKVLLSNFNLNFMESKRKKKDEKFILKKKQKNRKREDWPLNNERVRIWWNKRNWLTDYANLNLAKMEKNKNEFTELFGEIERKEKHN